MHTAVFCEFLSGFAWILNREELSTFLIFNYNFCQNVKSFSEFHVLRIHTKPDRNSQKLTVCSAADVSGGRKSELSWVSNILARSTRGISYVLIVYERKRRWGECLPSYVHTIWKFFCVSLLMPGEPVWVWSTGMLLQGCPCYGCCAQWKKII